MLASTIPSLEAQNTHQRQLDVALSAGVAVGYDIKLPMDRFESERLIELSVGIDQYSIVKNSNIMFTHRNPKNDPFATQLSPFGQKITGKMNYIRKPSYKYSKIRNVIDSYGSVIKYERYISNANNDNVKQSFYFGIDNMKNISEKSTFNIEAGAMANHIYSNDKNMSSDYNSSFFQFGPYLNFGLEYKLNDFLSLKAYSDFKFGVLRSEEDALAFPTIESNTGIGLFYKVNPELTNQQKMRTYKHPRPQKQQNNQRGNSQTMRPD